MNGDVSAEDRRESSTLHESKELSQSTLIQNEDDSDEDHQLIKQKKRNLSQYQPGLEILGGEYSRSDILSASKNKVRTKSEFEQLENQTRLVSDDIVVASNPSRGNSNNPIRPVSQSILSTLQDHSFHNLHRASLLNTSQAGRVGERERLIQIQQLALKQRLPWSARMKIYLYHLYEPILLAVSLGLTIQVVTFTCCVYLILMVVGIVPFIDSRTKALITLKQALCIFIAIGALGAAILKSLVMISIDDKPILTLFSENMAKQAQFWGVQHGQSIFIVLIDVVQLFVCILLYFVYKDHTSQAEQRSKIVQRVEMQKEIKIHHPLFGNKHKSYFTLVCALYLVDTFLIPNAIQLVVTCLILLIIFLWDAIVNKDHWSRMAIIRFIQLLSVLQALVSFTISMPIIADGWQDQYNLVGIGVCSKLQSPEDKVYTRMHYSMLCVAFVTTEVFITSRMVHKEYMRQEIGQMAKDSLGVSARFGPSQHMSIKDNMSNSHKFLKLSKETGNKLEQSGRSNKSSNLDHSQQIRQSHSGARLSYYTGNRPVSRTIGSRHQKKHRDRQGATIESKRVKASKAHQAKANQSFVEKLTELWKQSRLSIMIWVCRVFAFFQVYGFHDWQSLIFLLWIVHSTLYQKSSRFSLCMICFYLPFFTITFLWYYTINIHGVIDWESEESKLNQSYDKGFYEFRVPILEVGFLFCCLFSMIDFCRLLREDLDEDKESQYAIQKMQDRRSNAVYQLLFIMLIYIEYPLMIFLVMDGVSMMDLHHIMYIFFFILYTLFPHVVKRYSIVLLIYADLFILCTYTYTLTVNENDQPKNWVFLIGFYREYNTESTKEFWRLNPLFDEWCIIILSLTLYRRQIALGMSDQQSFDQYREHAENTIKRKLPWLYKLYIYWDIFYNHFIIIAAFTIFFAVLVFLDNTLLNGISQTQLLILLAIYLASGIGCFLSFWNILCIYQAIVLLTILIFQFMVNNPGYETSTFKEWYENLSPEWYNFLKWIGLEKYDDPIWERIAPYVILFSLSILLHGTFKRKKLIDKVELVASSADLSTHDKSNSSNQLDSTAIFKTTSVDQNKSQESSTYRAPSTTRLSAANNENPTYARHESWKQRKSSSSQSENNLLLVSASKSASADRKQIDADGFIFQVGFQTCVTTDKNEIICHQKCQEMKYKQAYLAYKLHFVWPVLDFLANYFNMILNTTIIAFALYSQISIFYCLCLLFLAIQSLMLASQNNSYRKKMVKKFKQKVEADEFESRIGLSARQELQDRATSYEWRIKRNDRNLARSMTQRRPSNQRSERSLGLRRFSNEDQVLATANQSFKQVELEEPLIYSQSLQNLPTQQSAERAVNNASGVSTPRLNMSTNTIEVEETVGTRMETVEESELLDVKRLIITDEEAIEEYGKFKRQIHKVIMKTRYFYWVVLMVLLSMALTLSYISTFEMYLFSDNSEKLIMSEESRKNLVFLFFWGGFYCDHDKMTYEETTYPFYILLILVIAERIAQIWVKDRFGCSPEQIEIFKDIEQRVKKYKDLAQKKRQETKTKAGTGKIAGNSTRGTIMTTSETNLSTQLVEQESAPDKSMGVGLLELDEIIEEDDDSHQQSSEPGDAQSKRSMVSFNRSMDDKDQAEQQARHFSTISVEDMDKDKSVKPSKNPLDYLIKSNESKIKKGGKKKSQRTYANVLETNEKRKKEILKELTPYLTIKDKMKIRSFIKALLESIIIMMIWFSTIFKQDIYSFPLFLMLVFYTYKRSGSALVVVRTTVSIMLFVEYLSQVIDFSSYNSDREFPKLLTGPDTTVYPNENNFYFRVPFFIWINTSYDSATQTYSAPETNLQQTTFWGLMITNKALNGIWWDVMTVVTVSIYYSLVNIWMIFRPVKIVPSQTTQTKLREYQSLSEQSASSNAKATQVNSKSEVQSTQTPRLSRTIKQLRKELKMQVSQNKWVSSCEESLYIRFPIVMVSLILAIAIFNETIISLGYLLIAMLLIIDLFGLSESDDYARKLSFKLKWILLPYLLLDVLFQLLIQIPDSIFFNSPFLQNFFGVTSPWTMEPQTISLGQDVKIQFESAGNISILMIKGLTFFIITVQLQILSSYEYKNYILKWQQIKEQLTRQLGLGISYRFNNFKNKQVLQVAEENDRIDRMLWHVKRLIRQRDKLYQINKNQKQSSNQSQFMRRMTTQQKAVPFDNSSVFGLERSQRSTKNRNNQSLRRSKDLERVSEFSRDESELDSCDLSAWEEVTKFDQEVQKEQERVKKSYDEQMRKLSCCQKLYLYLRRNFMNDIIFRQSQKHLNFIVEQLKSGRTSIKSNIEISIMNKTKLQCMQQKEAELNAMTSADDLMGRNSRNRASKDDKLITESPSKMIEEMKEESQLMVPLNKKSLSIGDKLEQENSNNDSSRIEAILQGLDKQDAPRRQQQNPLNTSSMHASTTLGEKLLKSEVYARQTDPWNICKDEDALFSFKNTSIRYCELFFKTLYSYSELPCYFFMVFQAITSPGILFLVFPIILFGYVLVEEKTPGRYFWYTVIIYTQFLIVTTFVLQLTIWQNLFNDKQKANFDEWLDSNVLGITKYSGNSFVEGFAFYYPQILLVLFILMHIQKETRLGVFDVSYEAYETFCDGLFRYRKYCVCKTEAERQRIDAEYWNEKAINEKLDEEEIRPYIDGFDYWSEFDKYERSEELGDPIYQSINLLDKAETPFVFVEHETEDGQIDTVIEMIQPQFVEVRARSKSEDNILSVPVQKIKKKENFCKKSWRFFYDNSLFDRLFPTITQQKPGKDLYVFIASIQILIIVYTFLFFNKMISTDNENLDNAVDSNYLSGQMVAFVLIEFFIMIIDRVIYSTHKFEQHQSIKKESKKYSQDEQLYRSSQPQNMSIFSGLKDRDDSVNYGSREHSAKSYPRARRLEVSSNVKDNKNESMDETQWFSLSEDSDELDAVDFRAYHDSLVPKKSKPYGIRVIRFYFLWVVLVLEHVIAFQTLPQTVRECKHTPQVKDDVILNYGDPEYECNTFGSNGYIQFFYILQCVYFCLSAYQIKVGLPEIRKGSFLVDSFNVYGSTIYRAYLAIPFIFELRSIIDWTFTRTALDVFQWIKLAQVQADLYVAKCVNKDYMKHKLGKQQPFWKKLAIGFTLTIFVLTLIIFPIILFSSLNPYPKIDHVTGGSMSMEIKVTMNDGVSGQNETLSYTLFTTEHVTSNFALNNTQYDSLDFNDQQQSTSKFDVDQTQAIQFSKASSYQWLISPYDWQQLNQTLTDVKNGQKPDVTLLSEIKYEFYRSNSRYGTASGNQKAAFTNETSVIDGLLNQINCVAQQQITTIPRHLIILQKTGGNSLTANMLNTNQAFEIGYTLEFFCSKQDATVMEGTYNYAYWQLTPFYYDGADRTQAALVKNMNNGIFSPMGGVGFFVFTSKTLPNIFADYGTSILVFYVSVIFVIAAVFRSAFVPKTDEIFIVDAPYTDDILKICQSIHIYRVQQELEKEEELYHILIDIMRSPEMIKSISGSSLKKKLQ